MYKLVDSTFVFVLKNDIKSIDLFPKICSRYKLLSTEDIRSEATKTVFPEEYVDIRSFPSNDYESIKDAVFRRRPQLHRGEISAIAASILLTENGIENYIVTDDDIARKSIELFSSDTMFWNKIKHRPVKLSYTGTIGLIRRLRDYGVLSLNECKSIETDLRNSSFRATEDLFKLLCD